MDPYIYILDNKKRPGDVLEMKETIKDTYLITKGKEIVESKKSFTKKGVSKIINNTYIIPVIETKGENHKERTDECKKSFTEFRVDKVNIIKYI